MLSMSANSWPVQKELELLKRFQHVPLDFKIHLGGEITYPKARHEVEGHYIWRRVLETCLGYRLYCGLDKQSIYVGDCLQGRREAED